MLHNGFLQEFADVIIYKVGRVISLLNLCDVFIGVYKSFFCSFCNHNDAVTLLLDASNYSLIETLLSLKLKWKFRHKTDVNISISQTSIS